MDPLFERRNLKKSIRISPKQLQKNMQASILAELRGSFEGRCSSEGFIQRNSITIINYSLGRADFRGYVSYMVEFQADVCMPHIGQRFMAPVTLRSKVGIHAESLPIKVLIPRDLHIGNEEFEKVNVEENIEFEVIGAQFKQKDTEIIVIARLLTKIAEPVEIPLLFAPPAQEVQLPTAPLSLSEQGEEKRVVITAPMQPEKPNRRRLRGKDGVNTTNEQFPSFKEGVVEGTA
jgi:DNA-directed RNA polymerase subunit E'/Rpb7